MSNFFLALDIISIFLLLSFSAFFSGTETAMTAAKKGLLLKRSKEGNKKAKITLNLLEKKEDLLSSILIGNNFANILASVIATKVLIKLYGEATGTILVTVVMTSLVVIFAEVLPKIYSYSHADNLSIKISPVINIIVKILWPLSKLVGLIAKLMVFLLGGKIKNELSQAEKEEELRGVIEMHKGKTPEITQERNMLKSIIDLDDVSVEEIIVHRSLVTSVDINTNVDSILKKFLNSPHLEIPVYEKNEHNIVGVINSKDFIKKYLQNKAKINIQKTMNKPWFVPGNTTLLDQIQSFKLKEGKIAFIVDEYGEYLGIISFKDILRYIIGDTTNLNDSRHISYIKDKNGFFNVDGDEQIRNINRETNINLDEENANTIAGYIMWFSKGIPNEEDVLIHKNVLFIIEKKNNRQLSKIKFKKIKH